MGLLRLRATPDNGRVAEGFFGSTAAAVLGSARA